MKQSWRKIIVVAWDGASWRLLDPWLKKGELPFLSQLIHRGVKRELLSTIPPRTAPAWGSFITGAPPSEHGVFDFFSNGKMVDRRDLKLSPFWSRWGKKKKICLLNLPLTYPPPRINGVVVSSFLTPPGKPFVYPAGFKQTLTKFDYRIDVKFERFGILNEAQAMANRRQLKDEIKKIAQARLQTSLRLLQKRDWDFFFVLFRATDLITHLYWRAKPTLEIYRLMDQFLAQIYKAAVRKWGARQTIFFLVSDHGFHPAPKYQFNIYPWLRKQGFLKGSWQSFLVRVWRKISFWVKDKSRFDRLLAPGELKVTAWGVWLKDKKRIDELQGALANVSFQRRRVFQEVVVNKGDGPDLLLLPHPLFAVGTSPVEGKIFIRRRCLLPATHDGDRRGILVAKGVGIKELIPQKVHIWDLPQIFNHIFYPELWQKIKKAQRVIRRALGYYGTKRSVVCWTGGKDSTLLLWLVRGVCKQEDWPLPQILFINEGDVFPEILRFRNRLARRWGFEFVEVANRSVLRQVRKLGDQVKVSKLDKFSQRELAKLGFKGKNFPFYPESLVGNHLMKTVPLKRYIVQNGIRAVFTGIRWDEQGAREGERYFSPRRDPPHTRIHPILHFTEADVWQTILRFGIPYVELYKKGYRSLGAKTTTKKVDNRPAWKQDFAKIPERAGRAQDKEKIMAKLRALGYM